MMNTASMPLHPYIAARVTKRLARRHAFEAEDLLSSDTIENALLSWWQYTLFCGKLNTKNRVFLLRWVRWLWLMLPRPLRSFSRGTARETTSAGGAVFVFKLVFICCLPNLPTVKHEILFCSTQKQKGGDNPSPPCHWGDAFVTLGYC